MFSVTVRTEALAPVRSTAWLGGMNLQVCCKVAPLLTRKPALSRDNYQLTRTKDKEEALQKIRWQIFRTDQRESCFAYLKWLLLIRKEINFPGVAWDEQSDNSAHAFRNLIGGDLNGEVFVCSFESHTTAA